VVQYQAGQIGDAAAKIHDKLREAASVMVGLDVRSLRATGQDDAADRMEMILRFQQERADIIAKFGASSGVLARALEVQGLELQKLDGAKLKALAEEAAQVRLDALPEESLRQQLERIEKLREQFPTILDEGVMQKLRERAGEAIEQARAAAGELGAQLSQGIKGFASSASDAFADMAVDGKASFNELLR
jgi:hypothetical protein